MADTKELEIAIEEVNSAVTRLKAEAANHGVPVCFCQPCVGPQPLCVPCNYCVQCVQCAGPQPLCVPCTNCTPCQLCVQCTPCTPCSPCTPCTPCSSGPGPVAFCEQCSTGPAWPCIITLCVMCEPPSVKCAECVSCLYCEQCANCLHCDKCEKCLHCAKCK